MRTTQELFYQLQANLQHACMDETYIIVYIAMHTLMGIINFNILLCQCINTKQKGKLKQHNHSQNKLKATPHALF